MKRIIKLRRLDPKDPGEKKIRDYLDKLKGKLMYPLLYILKNLKISPNYISYTAAFIGVCSAVLLFYDLELSAIALLISLTLDNIDGAYARYTKKANNFGLLTDVFSDQFIVTSTSIGYLAIGLVDPVIGGLYIALHPILSIFKILRHIKNIPRKVTFKPVAVPFFLFWIYVIWGYNWFDYLLLPCVIIMFIQIVIDFYIIRKLV